MTNTTELKNHLQEQVVRMYACLDAEDVGGYMAFFTEDASFESLFGAMQGRETIRDFMTNHVASGMEHGVRHFLSNFYLDVDGTTGKLSFYVAKMQVKVGPSLIGSAAAECHFDMSQGDTPLNKIILHIDEASLTTPDEL
ncbi:MULTISPECIES: nuclear transport factor 2 family protein [Falsihalocynthiibacter]|uniref:nuclear transport factor 2 family protein n=1 Tax=Falsihalocynthiibacter TaxID=2854182 RepID=UPI0030028BC0